MNYDKCLRSCLKEGIFSPCGAPTGFRVMAFTMGLRDHTHRTYHSRLDSSGRVIYPDTETST